MTEPLLDRLQEVASEIGAASHFLLCLDFDGTLAPIVPDPADAHIPGETRAVLEQLTSRPGVTVAVVSGRSVRDLQMRVGLNIILAGNHGLEMIEGNARWRHPAAARWEPVLHKICDELVARAGQIPGALIEDKGRTASFHYRNMASAEVPLILEILNTVVAPHDDYFFLRKGRKVFEILPKARWDKGSAVLRILEYLRKTQSGEIAVCYIGDDTTDECAFHQLLGAITIRVGERQPTAARFRVAGDADSFPATRKIHCPTQCPQDVSFPQRVSHRVLLDGIYVRPGKMDSSLLEIQSMPGVKPIRQATAVRMNPFDIGPELLESIAMLQTWSV